MWPSYNQSIANSAPSESSERHLQNVLVLYGIGKWFQLVRVQEWHQVILVADTEAPNMHGFSDDLGTHMVLPSDRQTIHEGHLSWIMSRIISFALKMFFFSLMMPIVWISSDFSDSESRVMYSKEKTKFLLN